MQAHDAAPESYWTAVGNIVRERPYGPGGLETRIGSKHFAPGAKVYIIDMYGGMCENIVVIGLHRKSKRLIKLVIDVRLVENLRPMVCYSPAVINKIKEHYPPTRLKRLTEEFAQIICQVLPHWQAAFTRSSVGVADAASTVDGNVSISTRPGFSLSQLWAAIRLFLKV